MQGTGRKTMAQLLVDVGRHVASVSAMLDGRDWLVGQSPTLADFAVCSMFVCYLDAPEVQEMFDDHSGVQAWMQRLRTGDFRPSCASPAASAPAVQADLRGSDP